MRPSASVDEIVLALEKDVTFSRTGTLRSAVFVRGQHPASDATWFWQQGNPLGRYGRLAARHELLHVGAALRGQSASPVPHILHELTVQAASTPELLMMKGALISSPYVEYRILCGNL